MPKEKPNQNENFVGAGPVSARNKTQNGITLIALIITIIVMLILVGVSVTVALNGGLFSTAKEATEETAIKRNEELNLSSGQVEIDGKKYASYEDYLAGDYIGKWKEIETKPEGWSENVTAITDGTNTIPLPNGFMLSTKETEDSIEEGLVVKNGENEFVWIPVADSASYTEDSFGPLTATDSTSTYVYDSQEELDYYYEADYYDYDDFTYETDKTNVENSIKTYGGFYVGRYETTIGGGLDDIYGYLMGGLRPSCKPNSQVLTYDMLTTSINYGGKNRPLKWWGMYKYQKRMYEENEAVGSLMISSKQWDAIMAFTGYGDATRPSDTYTTRPDKTGSAYKTDNTKYDVSKNIYDLAGNVWELTITASLPDCRIMRGTSAGASSSWSSQLHSQLVTGLRNPALELLFI